MFVSCRNPYCEIVGDDTRRWDLGRWWLGYKRPYKRGLELHCCFCHVRSQGRGHEERGFSLDTHLLVSSSGLPSLRTVRNKCLSAQAIQCILYCDNSLAGLRQILLHLFFFWHYSPKKSNPWENQPFSSACGTSVSSSYTNVTCIDICSSQTASR